MPDHDPTAAPADVPADDPAPGTAERATATGDHRGADADDGSRAALLAAAVVPALLLAVAGWQRRWTTDDAFINYRIVDQVVAGHGPVYNVGERVEAYTSTGWLAALTLGEVVLPLRLEHVAIALSLPLSALGIVWLSLASRRLLATAAPADAVWLPAGSLVLVALPALWDFSTAGLETGLTLAWTGLLALGLSRAVAHPEDAPWWALVVAGAAPLVRPDATIEGGLVLLFVVVGAWRAAGWRRAGRQVLVAAALPVAYQVFRMAFFAALVPNTALAKQATAPHIEEGWAYLVDLVGTYQLWVPLAALAVAGVVVGRRLSGRALLAVVLLPAAGLLHVAYVVMAGGDYAHARLLLPPLFALVAPVALLPATRRVAVVAPLGLVAVWAVVAAGWLRPGEAVVVNGSIIADGRSAIVGHLGVDHPVTAEEQGWGRGSDRAAEITADTVVVDSRAVPALPPADLRTPATAQYGIGVTGYSVPLDVYVIDRLGLADPLTSRYVVEQAGFIGHEKPIPHAWLAARISTEPVDPALLGDDGFATPLFTSTPGSWDGDVDAARAAWECPPLRELREATREPFTVGRAWRNLWRAPRLTRLEVAPDPHEALADLC
jgi:arabinofuranosyltransferase